MSQVYKFLLDLVSYAREHRIDLPAVGAYDDVRIHIYDDVCAADLSVVWLI